MSDAFEEYAKVAQEYWNYEYTLHGYKVVHDAGTKQKTIDLAAREMELFLHPNEELLTQLRNDKENNPYPTYTTDFHIHPPISNFIPDLKKAVALDYGCGCLARYTKAMAQHFNVVMGIDVSNEAIDMATKETEGLNNIALFRTDGLTINLPNNSIDFIFSNLVLQHIGFIHVNYILAQEFVRILKPGGLMRLEYLDGSQRKSNEFAHVAEGNGITRLDLESMYSKAKIVGITDNESSKSNENYLWISVTK